MAYVMGALRTVMEWATVPVLAVAMCLPHGALVYWLSSSTVSLAQVRSYADNLSALSQVLHWSQLLPVNLRRQPTPDAVS